MDYSKMDTDDLKALLKEEKHQYTLANTMQMAIKLNLNANYGATALRHYPLFNEELAAAITMNTRYFVRLMSENITKTIKKFTKNINPDFEPYVYSDTDSAYVSIAPLVEHKCKGMGLDKKTDWADAFTKKIIDDTIDKTIKQYTDLTNAYDINQLSVSREAICDTALWSAKKKYILRVRDLEGTRYPLDSPKIKVTGLEVKTSGIAPFTKKYLTQAIPVMLDKEEVEIKDWFNDVKGNYTHAHLLDIAKTIGVSKIEDPNWGQIVNGRRSSPPFGSKTVIATNNYIKKHNLEEEFELIQPGTKVKTLYLTKPNPLGNVDAFAFLESKFAERFIDYIDKDVTFDKFFVSPLKNITDALGFDVTNNVQELDEW